VELLGDCDLIMSLLCSRLDWDLSCPAPSIDQVSWKSDTDRVFELLTPCDEIVATASEGAAQKKRLKSERLGEDTSKRASRGGKRRRHD
jgi:hypothetical protein